MAHASETTASMRADLEATLPVIIDYGDGANVYDVDGRKYVDLTASSGAVLLGYRHAQVTDAVCEELRRGGGLLPSTLSPLQHELAKRLSAVFPCAERTLFFRTGSCATTAAIRLARLHTGRSIVLTSGYHGWHDWHLTPFPRFRQNCPGVIDFRYNLNLLEQSIADHAGDVACIIITPEPNFFEDGYLSEIRAIADAHSIVLIFDEVVSGFRYGLGGYQAACEVVPDMATIAKGLANGHALSAVIGRQDIIARRDETHLVGTFHHDRAPFAAALATLDILEAPGRYDEFFAHGRMLVDGLNAVFEQQGMVAEAFRHPGLFHILFDDEDLWQALVAECREDGVLLHPFDAQMITFAHTPGDIQKVLDTMDSAITKVSKHRPESVIACGGKPSLAALNYRTLHEFGGLIDYRLPIDQVPHTWHQDDR